MSNLSYTLGHFQTCYIFKIGDCSYWYLATKVGFLCSSNVKKLLNLDFLETY